MLFHDKRGTLAALAALAWAGAGFAQRAEGPRLPRADPPAPPVYSRDGTVAVYAPQSKAGYRMPVLTFVSQCGEDFQRALRLKLGSQLCPLEIAIGGKSDGDTRVLTARLRDPGGGGARERIELPDPEAADLDRFRRAVGVALLRAWMVEAGGTEATMRDLPMWLIEGALRYADREKRQADVDRTLLLWSRACLPPAAELFRADSLAATREPAVAAVLASWFMERRDGVSLFEALLRAAATGTEWSPARAAALLEGTDDLAAFDGKVDERMLAEGRVVAKPGLTTAGIVRRFRSHLLLAPVLYGKTLGKNRLWWSFQDALPHADAPEVRASAAAQAARVKTAAVGRDGILLAVSEAYTAFLEALAKGAKPGELSRLLLEAEGMRRTLEEKAGRGEVLQRK
jgi:hypothetical protein